MMKKPVQTTVGFTLIEVLVYLGILLVVSTASVGFLISLNDFITQYQLETALYRSGTNALEQIVVGLREADQFDAVNSVIDNTASGTLAVISGATTTTFAKVGSELDLRVNGVNSGNLMSEGVTVTGFTVYRYNTAAGQLIRVKLDLSATVDSNTKTISLYGSGVIRGAL